MKLKIWFFETRPQFLLLSAVLAFLGTAVAWHDGSFNFAYAILAFIGLLMTHISVNTLNDYFDYKSGVDLVAKRTPFSGGSGILPAHLLTGPQVFWLGIGSFLVATAIGAYFITITNWILLPLLLVAGFCVLLYNPVILKTWWPEWAPGLGLGVLPVMGLYFAQTAQYTWAALVAAVPSGFLVHNLLLLNEFPDVDADKTDNRKTLPITMGPRGAGIVYSAVTIAVYVWIVAWVIAGKMPVFALLGLLTLPFAFKAIRGALNSQELSRLVPAMAANVMVVLLTQLFIGIGYILDKVL